MFTVNQTNREENPASLPDDDIVVLFDRKCVLMSDGGSRLPRVADLRASLDEGEPLVLGGSLDGRKCWGLSAGAALLAPPGFAFVECRGVFVQNEDGLANAVSRCRELAEWRQRHRFCGRCCHRLEFSDSDLAAKCQECGALYYPQIAPAVIVAILRGNELLLANNRRFAERTYSLIAGFVEAGESMEDAVHREVFEETNLRVKNLRYLYSQPWPFPNSLMLGMIAEYDSGKPVPNDGELTDIQWFPLDRLPKIPAPGSIAHRIITELAKKTS